MMPRAALPSWPPARRGQPGAVLSIPRAGLRPARRSIEGTTS